MNNGVNGHGSNVVGNFLQFSLHLLTICCNVASEARPDTEGGGGEDAACAQSTAAAQFG